MSGTSKVLAASSVVLSVGISFLASLSQKALAAASFAVFTNLLKVATIVADSVLDVEARVSPLSWLGILAAFAGGLAYSACRAECEAAPQPVRTGVYLRKPKKNE